MEKAINTDKGVVLLVRDVGVDYLSSLIMEDGMGIFFHYRYEEARKTKQVLSDLCADKDNMVVCAVKDDALVGYVTIVKPEPGTRWDRINASLVRSSERLQNPVLMELGSIEISTPWRSMGLGRELLAFTFEDPRFEEKIVFSRELSWHWDLRSSDLSVYEYRSMLLRLFESAGFRYTETDDDEICYSGENMFTARVGRNVPLESAFLFFSSLRGSAPRGWGWG
jgi:acetoin utilization protein AcuA